MPLSGPSYPVITQAEDAAIVLGTALATKTLNTPEEIQAAYIVAGYGLSLGFGSPTPVPAPLKAKLTASVKTAAAFNWLSLIQLVLQMLAALQPPAP